LEGVVFGARAGKMMISSSALPFRHGSEPEPAQFPNIAERELRAIAWNSCGILRSGPELSAAHTRFRSRSFQISDGASRSAFELRNMLQVATLISFAALAREESRGGHYRIDFPQKSAAFEKHSVITRSGQDAQLKFA
jgi:L-aspartate oxidase